jgi:cytochrome o ubiquinol oxidase subunit 2
MDKVGVGKRQKKHSSVVWPILVLLSVLTALFFFIKHLIKGKNVALLNPKGLIAQEQYNLLVFTVTVLLAAVIPTMIILYYTAWKYRESNSVTAALPEANKNKHIVAYMWAIPIVIMLVLANTMWPATHRLAIYPDQKIATVNFVQIPINTPVKFEMTADEMPMSSFWIPNLGGQLYTMTGHVNRLNLMADTLGDYPGSTPEINGIGFAGMKFTARVSSDDDFDQWVKQVKSFPEILDSAKYEDILRPSEYNSAAFYSAYENNLYDKVVLKYTGSTEGHTH